MAIQVFYHITCIGPWENIMNTQIQKLIYSGLYEDAAVINCYVLGAGNVKDFQRCLALLSKAGKKFKVVKENAMDRHDEAFTLSDIRNHITPESKVLYLHTKGVTRYASNVYKIGDHSHVIDGLFDHVMDWNNIMEYVLIKNYKVCLEALKTYDVVGMNYLTHPPHFSGNFWWCTGKHYLSLPENVSICEAHICLQNPRAKNMFNSGLAGYGHYFHGYSMSNYIDTLRFP